MSRVPGHARWGLVTTLATGLVLVTAVPGPVDTHADVDAQPAVGRPGVVVDAGATQNRAAGSAGSDPADDFGPNLCMMPRTMAPVDTANGKVRVWYEKDEGEAGRDRARALAGVINNRIWPRLTNLMARGPLPDHGSGRCRGGDDRLDILLRGLLTCCGHAYSYGDACRAPAYIVLERHQRELNPAAAHEIMHAIQWAFDACDAQWLYEATAAWAEDYVFPDAQTEQENAPRYLADPRVSLDSPIRAHQYGAYLLPFFLAGKGRANAIVVRRIWLNARTMTSLDAVDRAMQGGFAKRWKQFALYNWNSPPVARYRAWDGLVVGARPDGGSVQDITLGRSAQKTLNVRAGGHPRRVVRGVRVQK
jgi:hypothetical protein